MDIDPIKASDNSHSSGSAGTCPKKTKILKFAPPASNLETLTLSDHSLVGKKAAVDPGLDLMNRLRAELVGW